MAVGVVRAKINGVFRDTYYTAGTVQHAVSMSQDFRPSFCCRDPRVANVDKIELLRLVSSRRFRMTSSANTPTANLSIAAACEASVQPSPLTVSKESPTRSPALKPSPCASIAVMRTPESARRAHQGWRASLYTLGMEVGGRGEQGRERR